LKGGGLLKSERFLDMIFEDLGPLRFEDLRIPLHIVATEYWTGREFVFDSGDVLLAIRASMAIPGVFAPVAWQGNLLIDGGISNQVPYEILLDQCDLTIAVDVGQQRIQQGEKRPDRIDLLVGSFEIVQERLLEERMKHRPPDIYIHPAMRDIDLLDFDKINNALEQARPAVAELKTRLEAIEARGWKRDA
jgi:NTE family protein